MSYPTRVDPRGLRFAAAITSVVLAASLVTPLHVAIPLLAIQAIVFALGAFGGPHTAPYGVLFKQAVRPRIGAPTEFEDARPPRFAQLVGLTFLVVALVGFVSGLGLLAYVAIAFALVAALLNAAVGFCLGCEIYLLLRRLTPVKVEA